MTFTTQEVLLIQLRTGPQSLGQLVAYAPDPASSEAAIITALDFLVMSSKVVIVSATHHQEVRHQLLSLFSFSSLVCVVVLLVFILSFCFLDFIMIPTTCAFSSPSPSAMIFRRYALPQPPLQCSLPTH